MFLITARPDTTLAELREQLHRRLEHPVAHDRAPGVDRQKTRYTPPSNGDLTSPILAFAERVLPRAADLWCRRRSNSASGSNNCSFQTESHSTEKALLDPA